MRTTKIIIFPSQHLKERTAKHPNHGLGDQVVDSSNTLIFREIRPTLILNIPLFDLSLSINSDFPEVSNIYAKF